MEDFGEVVDNAGKGPGLLAVSRAPVEGGVLSDGLGRFGQREGKHWHSCGWGTVRQSGFRNVPTVLECDTQNR